LSPEAMRGISMTARSTSRLVAVALATCVLLSACGSASGSADPQVIHAGPVDIKLPDGYKVENQKIIRPAGSGSTAKAGGSASNTSADASTPTTPGATAAPGATTTTGIPLKKDTNATTDLFAAFGKFRQCLTDTGTKFIGAPNQADPNSPTNDPTYVKNLSTCAARSNIVQALKDSQAANDNLTPAQIQDRNKSYLKWRTCMINRGWKIATPTPDAQGRLFAFGGGGGGGGGQNQIQPPAGKDLLTSSDIQQCADKVAPKPK
jgi:hypothetical protein